ncbi:penicillin-binding transpeptidase domain-containing protein [Corynebacterium breve]|uniref:Penicillin-binding transpeptidase domain-containing protein n=1 Tax=Corynebacterium breve TaxID=3049799 RepID=A0ABY8VJH5_9CORY|nr:penicillin-binding transpeptidase domain-containing protein [Corynebacterium breve]WIM67730.1 penicillin-binding transpeptidase domain-containing protein [Corynebacterium breve]
MNRSIRFGAIFALLLTLVLLVNLTIVQVFSEEKYAQNPLNSRGYITMKQTQRGQINAGGQILAESNADADGFYQRSYPTSAIAFAPVVGYLSDQYGAAGLESGYNGTLSGDTTSLMNSRFLATGYETRVGNSIELTMDPTTQDTAYNQLTQNGFDGAVVAMRPSTGAILAMASTPSYNPNEIINPETSEAAWSAVNNDPGQPLINHATQDQLPPGSIFKIITTAAGLEHGYTPDSQLTGAASITLPDTVTELTNYGGTSCGGSDSTTLQKAFELSCNTAFVEMATDIGPDALRDAATAFGVGENYDLGIPTATGTLGDLPDLAATGQSSIGQRDVTMTALQAAVMAATVANEGRRMEPYLINRVLGPELQVKDETKPKEITQAISPEQASTLTDLMLAAERSAYGSSGEGFASKTGTAEHADDQPPHVWYVAFDPDKDVAVAVVVKNGGGYGESATGGRVAGPVGRAVLNAAPAGGGE